MRFLDAQIVKTFFTFLLIAIFLVVGEFFGVLGQAKNIVSYVSVPLQFFSQKSAQSVAANFSGFGSGKELQDLRTKLAEFKGQEALIGELRKENEILRLQAQTKEQFKSYRLISANTIGLQEFLILDKGEKNKVKVGMVVVFKNNYIGRIIRTTARTSTVLILKDSTSQITAKTQSGAKGVISGQFGTDLLFDKVLKSQELKEGDLVLTTGEIIGDSLIPANLVLGKITKVEDEPTQAFNQGKVESFVPLDSLETVFVLFEK